MSVEDAAALAARPLQLKLDSIATTVGLEDAVGRCRIFGELVRRTSRTSDELSAAIGTYMFEDGARAFNAERAFKRADERVVGFRRQVTVTAFAVRSQLEHFCSFAAPSQAV